MKRVPELRALSNDHHRGLVLARKAKKSGTESDLSLRDMWVSIELYFKTDLEPHFQIEELHIGSNLEAAGESGMAKRLYEEHDALRRFIHSKSERTSSNLQKFGELLEEHIRFEERELFEVAQNNLSADVLFAIEKACYVKNFQRE